MDQSQTLCSKIQEMREVSKYSPDQFQKECIEDEGDEDIAKRIGVHLIWM